MWLFTKYGFFSAVCAKKKNGEIDGKRMVIRARVDDHLAYLIDDVFDDDMSRPKILSGTGTDYPHRIVISFKEWNRLCWNLSQDVDYTNFKDAARKFHHVDLEYAPWLNEIWRSGVAYQQRAEEGIRNHPDWGINS